MLICLRFEKMSHNASATFALSARVDGHSQQKARTSLQLIGDACAWNYCTTVHVSNAAHGWPIADCTSEAMLAALAVHDLAIGTSTLAAKQIILPLTRFEDSIELLSRFQNSDGGWATYEETRGGNWYEYLNPAEVFGDIMIDYT